MAETSGNRASSVPSVSSGVSLGVPSSTANAFEMVRATQLDSMQRVLGPSFSTSRYLESVQQIARSQLASQQADRAIEDSERASLRAQRAALVPDTSRLAQSFIGRRQMSPFASLIADFSRLAAPSLSGTFVGAERARFSRSVQELIGSKFDATDLRRSLAPVHAQAAKEIAASFNALGSAGAWSFLQRKPLDPLRRSFPDPLEAVREEGRRVARVKARWGGSGFWFVIAGMPVRVVGHLEHLDVAEAEEALLDALEDTLRETELLAAIRLAAVAAPFLSDTQRLYVLDALDHVGDGDWRRAEPYLQRGLEGGIWTAFRATKPKKDHKSVEGAIGCLPVGEDYRRFVRRHAPGGEGNSFRHGEGDDLRRQVLLGLLGLVGLLHELSGHTPVRHHFVEGMGTFGLHHLRARRTLGR